MYGLTPQGFKRKSYEVVVSEMETRAKNLYGENVNLTERSPLGIFIRIIAWFLGITWQLAEKIYNSAFVDTAEGVQLDKVAKYIGIKRLDKLKSTGEINITGQDGTVVPTGFQVASGDIIFQTTETVTISSGSATSAIECIEAGTIGNLPANTITTAINPIAGVDSVTNSDATVGGRDEETDESLRERYSNSIAKGAASTLDGIRAAILEVSGVISATVQHNVTNTTDASGRPPKSIQAIVYGGSDNDIAQAILETKAAGIESYGTTTIALTDLSGNSHDISFSRPTEIDIYVNVVLTTDSNFPTNGDTQVRTKIIEYIGGLDEDSTEYDGLGLGEDVIWTKVIYAVQTIPGITDAAVTLSIDGIAYNSSNIAISDYEVAVTEFNKVVIS